MPTTHQQSDFETNYRESLLSGGLVYRIALLADQQLVCTKCGKVREQQEQCCSQRDDQQSE
jgi:hypothetical protein